jgi:hypothetical protein
LNFEKIIAGHEILAENELFSKLFWILNLFLITFDHKCYTWFESSGTVENWGTFGLEFTLNKKGEIIFSGFWFDTVSHSWHLLIPAKKSSDGKYTWLCCFWQSTGFGTRKYTLVTPQYALVSALVPLVTPFLCH